MCFKPYRYIFFFHIQTHTHTHAHTHAFDLRWNCHHGHAITKMSSKTRNLSHRIDKKWADEALQISVSCIAKMLYLQHCLDYLIEIFMIILSDKANCSCLHRSHHCEHAVLWWSHQMETFSALLAICVGNSAVSGEFPAQRPVRWSFDVFFDLRPKKRFGKQSRGWWFETPSCPLLRHCNVASRAQRHSNPANMLSGYVTVGCHPPFMSNCPGIAKTIP